MGAGLNPRSLSPLAVRTVHKGRTVPAVAYLLRTHRIRMVLRSSLSCVLNRAVVCSTGCDVVDIRFCDDSGQGSTPLYCRYSTSIPEPILKAGSRIYPSIAFHGISISSKKHASKALQGFELKFGFAENMRRSYAYPGRDVKCIPFGRGHDGSKLEMIRLQRSGTIEYALPRF